MHGKLLAHKAVHKMRAMEATRKKKKSLSPTVPYKSLFLSQ